MGGSSLTEQVIVGVSLIFKGESTVTDVVQILQPLKVGDSHTAGIQVHVLRQGGRRQEARKGNMVTKGGERREKSEKRIKGEEEQNKTETQSYETA